MKRYPLVAAGALLGCVLATTADSQAGTFKHITIDGSFTDWAGVPPAYTDDADAPGQFDFKDVYVANDENFLYVRVTLYAPANAGAFHHHIVIDADANLATGLSYLGIGSELLVEDGAGWQQKNGSFNEGAASDLNWASAPSGTLSAFEARISRRVRDAEGQLVLTNPAIALALEVLDSNWASKDAAPATEGIFYEFAPQPAKATGSVSLLDLTSPVWRVNDSGADLGTDWLAADYDDTQPGWTSGRGLFGFGVPAGVYPAAMGTSLAAGSTTYYLRVPFAWNFDSLGVALPADLFVSDGAIVYLNGAEIRRLRLPAGPITASTPATGGPATPGQPETLVLPAAALVVGENLLAVEVHQAAGTPAELAFGLKLIATDSLPPAIEDPALPADRTVVEGESTTFSAGTIRGTEPLTYRWFKDGLPIADATNATFTLPVVLVGDAGRYHVEVSNATGIKAASRAALLTTTANPVNLTDPAEPADRTIAEGETTSFAVSTAGSPTLFFQWYKDGIAIEGATSASYAIADATLSDAGAYSLTVSNRVNAVTSRAARLTVVRDTTPPTIAQIAAAARTVTVRFSEPLDSVTAGQSARYGITGGAVVQAASLDPADSRTVRLTTAAPLAFGQVYRLSVMGVADRFSNAATVSAPFRATILIDGDFDDWAGITPAAVESQDTAEGREFKEIYIANDTDYLYVRFSFYASEGPLGQGAYYHIFSDTDNDLGTGFPTAGIGSEMMIENGSGYQQKGGQFNEGGVRDLDFLLAPEAPATEFECRISRRAAFDSDGLPIYYHDTIGVALQLISAQWSLLDTAPQGGPLVYTFEPVAPMELGRLTVRATAGNVEISWNGPGVLQSTDTLSGGTWATISNATSPQVVSPNATQRYFRLRQDP